MAHQITGVFEGGGIRGIALLGAAAATMDNDYRFDRVVGTSAGAIVSSLLAAGYTSDELLQAVTAVEWRKVLTNRNALVKNVSMVLRLGFHPGGRLERMIEGLLAAKGVEVFGDLRPGSLRVVATELNHGRGLVLPDSLPSLGYEPDRFPVARAVLMSSSVPFVFEPVPLEDRTTGERLLMADGAMTARFPVQLVRRAPTSLGFRLRHPKETHRHVDIRGPVSLANAVIGAAITAREDLPLLCGQLDRVVEVVVEHEALDFDITKEEAETLFRSGYEQAESQLETQKVS